MSQNLMNDRSRFTTFASLAQALAYQEERSSYSHSLNGEWKFFYLSSPDLTPDSFLKGNYETISWNTISVPGHPELQGYGKPVYTNFDYPFSVDPPHVPAENPTSLYYREFQFVKNLNKQVLRFDGVDSSFEVWMNGQYIGKSQGSRLMTEFNVTDFLKNGQNSVAVRVFKWSKGSYLEDQDMWWLSGIFRDVTIIEENSVLDDIKITPFHENHCWQVDLAVKFCEEWNEKIQVGIYFETELKKEKTTEIFLGENHFKFEIESPQLWTHETPNLYLCIVKIGQTYISIRFGLREIKLKNDLMCLNDRPILINGVNRHEFNCETGRSLTKKEILDEVRQIKKCHINAIRTSHYPNIPYFYDVCDELGLMVIDECDIETHGFAENLAPAKDKNWTAEFVSRGLRMVHRDYNHPCILIWSLGNESYFGENFVAMAQAVRALDPSRLIHYEGDHQTKVADMYSSMYTTVADMKKRAGQKISKLPHILCEYGHAMGNGPGSLQEYQDLFRLYDSIQGGFIWEWKDHGLKRNRQGEDYFAFGGDFGEPVHDGDFVIDGLVLPDNTPSPGLLEYQQVIQPFEFFYHQHTIAVKSLYQYKTCEKLLLVWELMDQGILVESGTETISKLFPDSLSKVMELAITSEKGSADTYIQFSIVLDEKDGIFQKGAVIARKQFNYQGSSPSSWIPVNTSEIKQYVTINTGNLSVRINKRSGNISQIMKGEQSLLKEEVRLGLWRKPLCNDKYMVNKWLSEYMDQLTSNCRSISYHQSEKTVLVLIRQYVSPPVVNWGIELAILLWISGNGTLTMSVKGWFDGDAPRELPRIGYDLPMISEVDTVTWYGRGPQESYPDSKASAFIGKYRASLADWRFPYIIKQESGNRTDLRWAQVKMNGGGKLTFKSTKLFNFNMVPIAETTARTDFKSVQDQTTVLRMDHLVRGLGSNSCGPEPLERYKVFSDPFEFVFQIVVE